jgi:hypothetical protein
MKWIILVAISVILAGCGGGNSSSKPAVSTPTAQGTSVNLQAVKELLEGKSIATYYGDLSIASLNASIMLFIADLPTNKSRFHTPELLL